MYLLILGCVILVIVRIQIDAAEARLRILIEEKQCDCVAVAPIKNTNQVNIKSDDGRDERIRDILRKNGSIE